MFRFAIPFVALLLFVPVATAQPKAMPLSPGVMPGSPWGPGMPFVSPTPTFPAKPGMPGMPGGNPGFPVFPPKGNTPVFFPVGLPWLYPSVYPFGAGPIVIPAYGQLVPTQPAIVTPAPSEPSVVLANAFPATLSLQFPAAAEVWLNDKKVSEKASEEQVLTSPVLKPNESYTFAVRARWTQGGKTYESKRNVTLGPGDRSRLLIVSGEEVK